MFFSVLIPVYNAEKYLEECLVSVLNQTEKDYEIVIVDDGSTDSSGKICDRFSADYASVIRVKHTKNAGQLAARNELISMAKGNYLVHLDADDFLRENTLSVLRSAIMRYSADLIIYTIHRIGVDGVETDLFLSDKTQAYEGKKKAEIYETICKSDIINNYVTKVASRELVQSCKREEYPSSVCIGEDVLQSLPLITNAKKIVYLNEPLYCYRKNNTSITATSGLKRYESESTVFRELLSYAEQWGIIDNVYRDILKRYASMCIDSLIISERYGNHSTDFFLKVSSDNLFLESKRIFKDFPIWKRMLGHTAILGNQKAFYQIQNIMLKLSQLRKLTLRSI